jgi:glycosyltransferase involved in cell wall biosynthesis
MKPRLLVISAVKPFPLSAGQQQRVYYKLHALRPHFHITFLTFAANVQQTREKLAPLVDNAVVLPALAEGRSLRTLPHKLGAMAFTLRTGIKESNYTLGHVELSPARIAAHAPAREFDAVLYEYWHTVDSVPYFRQAGAATVLDMHNVLWQSYKRQLESRRRLPSAWRNWAIRQYKVAEEAAWRRYDALIAINAGEMQYTRQVVGESHTIFYAPMGTDLSKWMYSPNAAHPPRFAYYGGLGNVYNQQEALRCYEHVMPTVWQHIPNAELWLVGSNPPDSFKAIAARDPRVHVTGFVERAQDVLNTMTAVLCPFSATYGFRSRLVEVMALGVPVVATPEAVYGMDMEADHGLLLGNMDTELAEACLKLVREPQFAAEQSRLAREQMERKFSYEATYGRLAQDLVQYVAQQRQDRTVRA